MKVKQDKILDGKDYWVYDKDSGLVFEYVFESLFEICDEDKQNWIVFNEFDEAVKFAKEYSSKIIDL